MPNLDFTTPDVLARIKRDREQADSEPAGSQAAVPVERIDVPPAEPSKEVRTVELDSQLAARLMEVADGPQTYSMGVQGRERLDTYVPCGLRRRVKLFGLEHNITANAVYGMAFDLLAEAMDELDKKVYGGAR